MMREHKRALQNAGFNKHAWKGIVVGAMFLFEVSKLQWLLPVAVGESAEMVEVESNYAILRVKGWKILNCFYITDAQTGYVRNSTSEWIRVSLAFLDPKGNRERSAFKLDFGNWFFVDGGHLSFDLTDDDVEFFATVQHSCEANKNTLVPDDHGNQKVTIDPDAKVRFTEIGPFKIND